MFHSYFEYIDASSSRSLKFWEIATVGVRVTIRQGKVGTVGKIETQENSFVEACAKQVEKKIQVITSKGYIKIDLENLQQLNKLSIASITSILAGSQAPVIFLDWAAGHDSVEVLSSVATHPQATKLTLEKLLHSHKSVAELAKLHVNYAGEMSCGYTEAAIGAIQTASLDPNRKQILELAALDVIPDYLLETLEQNLKVAIAKNPQTSASILSLLGNNWHECVRMAVAANEKAPSQILNQLANDKAVDVKVAVAKNPNTPAQSLIELASDAYEKVRSAILQNPNVPGEVVFKLRNSLGYRGDSILAKVATDPNLSSQTLEQLAQSNASHTRSRVAGNLNTPLSTLKQLASDDRLHVREAVAKNPNATEEILIEVLCYQHKKEDLVNRHVKPPVLILVEGKERFVEEPIYSGDEDTLATASQHPNLPLQIIGQLIQNLSHILQWNYGKTIIQGIASNLNIHKLALDFLIQQNYQNINLHDIYSYLINYFSTATSSFQSSEANKVNYVYQRQFWHERITEEFIVNFISEVYWGITNHSQAPLELRTHLLDRLTSNNNFISCVYSRLLENSDTPSYILERLSEYRISKSLVSHPNTPSRILAKVADTIVNKMSTDSDTKIGIAKHPNAAPEALTLLAKDKYSCSYNGQKARYFVREAVASNRNTSADTLALLAQDENEIVRAAVAGNSNTPANILTELACDRIIAYAYQSNGETYYAPSNFSHQGKPVLPICLAVANNPSTPLEILSNLAYDKDEQVRKAAKAQLSARNKVSTQQPDLSERKPELPVLLSKYAKSSSAFSRLVALLHPQTPVDTLLAAFQSSSWLERYAVAQNSNTPEDILEQLTRDTNRIVRATAKANLEIKNIS